MARLPKVGEESWGELLNDWLKQSHDHTGKMLSGPINPHTGKPNANLADDGKAGLIRLAGDLSPSASAPKVTGLQGNPVAPTTPEHGQTLVWNNAIGQWEPASLSSAGYAQSMAINSMRI
jgi:hypothetical protein